jgi:hypothetical protein
MKKNYLEVAQQAFDKTGASYHVSSQDITANLSKLLMNYAGVLKQTPGVSFGQFCENLGSNIVAAVGSPDIQLVRARIMAHQNGLK